MARLILSISLCLVFITSGCSPIGLGTFNGTIILHGPWPYDLGGIAFDAIPFVPSEITYRTGYQIIRWADSEIDSIKTVFDNSSDETVELSFTWTLTTGTYQLSLWTWGQTDSTEASGFMDVLVARDFIKIEYQKLSEQLIYDGPIFRP